MSDTTTPPKPTLPKSLPFWVLAVFAVGGPSAVVFNFQQWALQHPWTALGLFLLYELGVFLVGFALKIWQHLESSWTKEIAARLDDWVRGQFSSHRRHYLKQLVYRHRNVDVKGLSTHGPYTLSLERVFVDLRMVPTAPHRASTDPIRSMPQVLREGRHGIGDYLATGSHLAIIGAPGSGKTTLLKHLALALALGKGELQPASPLPNRIPILLYLRDHAEAIAGDPIPSLPQLLQDNLTQWEMPLSAPWLASQLDKGRCLVMLDGLDEVAALDTRKQVVRWVEQQIAAHGENRFLVTSRPYGYQDNPLSASGVTVLQIQPFTQAQVRHFVENWYLANEIQSQQKDDPGVHTDAREGAEDLLKRLRTAPALLDLAVNPLLLTMIATIHRYRSALPGRRVELYAEICEVFLGKRRQARGLDLDLTPAQKQSVLEPLAFRMMMREERELPAPDACRIIAPALRRVSPEIPCERFLEQVEHTSGLLLERENSRYAFAHLTFQEYLAASYMRGRQVKGWRRLVANPWWRETLLLYAAQGDATGIIGVCLEGDPPDLASLVFAFECQEEARELDVAMRTRLDELLTQGIEDTDLRKRRWVAEVLLDRRLRHLIPMDNDRQVDPGLISCAEYQLFLDERRTQGEYLQPDHWLGYSFPEGMGMRSVTGVRSSDAKAFCNWLTGRRGDDWSYRLPQDGELKDHPLDSDEMGGAGYWVCGKVFTVADAKRMAQVDVIKVFDRVKEWILSSDNDRALDRALDRDRALALDLALVLGRDFDLVYSQARAYSRALAHDSDPDRAHDSDPDRAHDSDLNRALDRARARARDIDIDRALARAHDSDSDTGRTRNQKAIENIFRLIFHRNREHVIASLGKVNKDAGWGKIVRFLCYLELVLVSSSEDFRVLSKADLQKLSSSRNVFRRFAATGMDLLPNQKIQFQRLQDDLADMLWVLLQLQARREGLLPAFEGIRIVRESRKGA